MNSKRPGRDCGCPWYMLPDHRPACMYYGSISEDDEKYVEKLAEMAQRTGGTTDTTSTTIGTKTVRQRLCTHAADPFILSDGGIVYATSYYDRDKRWKTPDFGVYLDSLWSMAHGSFGSLYLDWPDYNTPDSTFRELLSVLRYIHSLMEMGKMIEVGCLGAHGRTGTFLALMEVLARGNTIQVGDAEEIIAKVRKSHCSRAIETDQQEWLVEAMICYVKGEAIPAKPEKVWATYGTWDEWDEYGQYSKYVPAKSEAKVDEAIEEEANAADACMRFTGDNATQIVRWADEFYSAPAPIYEKEGILWMETFSGLEIAKPGDYVVRSVDGEFYPVTWTELDDEEPDDDNVADEDCDRCWPENSVDPICLNDCDCACHDFNTYGAVIELPYDDNDEATAPQRVTFDECRSGRRHGECVGVQMLGGEVIAVCDCAHHVDTKYFDSNF